MLITGRRRKIIFFIVLGVCLVVLAVALNVSWIILNWREGIYFFFGIIFFLAIILGLILNTIYLVREIRRNEQHDSFINAVTHELKTPIASIRLYLATLQSREVHPQQRLQFYRFMLDDTDRLLGTVEQVLKAGEVGVNRKVLHSVDVDFTAVVRGCIELARARHHLGADSLHYRPVSGDAVILVQGVPDELRTAGSNILD